MIDRGNEWPRMRVRSIFRFSKCIMNTLFLLRLKAEMQKQNQSPNEHKLKHRNAKMFVSVLWGSMYVCHST